MARDDIRRAVEYFQAALASDPENKEAKMCLYMAYNRQGKPQYAEKYYDGKIPVVNAPYSYTPYSSKDTSYIEWHKKQVIEKWKRIFNVNLMSIGSAYKEIGFDDVADVLCYQLILSPLKRKETSKNKVVYSYLAHPLYCKDKRTNLPMLLGNMEVEKKDHKHSEIESLDFRLLDYIPENEDDFITNIHGYCKGDNLLEKIEYEYYTLWAHYYLGLWQYEQWNPQSTMEEIVGKKHLIIGIDEEMHEIACELNEKYKKEGKIISTVYLDDIEMMIFDEFKMWLLERPLSDCIELNYEMCSFIQMRPLQSKCGIYGCYYVSSIHADIDGNKFVNTVFGSFEGQELRNGDFIRVLRTYTTPSRKEEHIHDGACIIV